MVKSMIILSYDLGTSFLKATLVGLDGGVLASVGKSYKTYTDGTWVEQQPEDWWFCLCSATRELVAAYPGYMKQVGAIGVSGHMTGCLPVDASGAPLGNAIIHSDSRAVAQVEKIERIVGKERLYQKTGCVLDPKNTLCKLLWLRDNDSERYHRTARFLQSKDYLTARLTGKIDVTDYSDASHAMLLDIHKRTYLRDELEALGLDAGKLPALYRGIDVVGSVTEQAGRELGLPSGIPVVAGGGDGACANVGAGICAPGDIYCSLGTTAWIAYHASAPVIDRGARIFDIISLDGECFGVFGTMQTAGKSVDWVRELFGLDSNRTLDTLAKESPAGSGGLIFLPYLEGERSPIFDSRARSLFFGISASHTRSHFLRAVLEGVAYGLRSILEVHREAEPIGRMRIIGGGAKSPIWLQIIADVCNVELELLSVSSDNLTSLGAAFAAGVGVGAYRNLEQAISCVKPAGIVAPNPENREVYDAGFAKYRDLYPSVKQLF